MRLFVGIPLPDLLIDDLLAISLRLQSSGDGLRWSAPESWHITLQFLGTTSSDQYECIVEQLHALRASSVSIHVNVLGFFDRVGIFFAGFELTPKLLGLQEAVTAATSPCGFIPDTRPYHPHVTLARTKGKGRANSLGELKARMPRQPLSRKFVADTLALYESVTGPGGSRYTVLHHFRLGSPPAGSEKP